MLTDIIFLTSLDAAGVVFQEIGSWSLIATFDVFVGTVTTSTLTHYYIKNWQLVGEERWRTCRNNWKIKILWQKLSKALLQCILMWNHVAKVFVTRLRINLVG
jgi:hypothetical protein